MSLRRGIILMFTANGGLWLVLGTPEPYHRLTIGATMFLLAYVYAELTRPKGL